MQSGMEPRNPLRLPQTTDLRGLASTLSRKFALDIERMFMYNEHRIERGGKGEFPVKLSSRQERILEFIRDFLEDSGYPPTIREIGKAVDISSTSVVNYNLNVLQKKGLLKRGKEVARGLRLISETGNMPGRSVLAYEIPILGTIAAGEPLLIPDDSFSTFSAHEHDDTVSLAQDMIPQGDGIYALRVQGDSMIDALVHDGDIIVLRHQADAENGEMVAAWIKDKQETTLKRFYREKDEKGKGRIRLQPANSTMLPIYIKPENLEIRGKVMVVIRRVH